MKQYFIAIVKLFKDISKNFRVANKVILLALIIGLFGNSAFSQSTNTPQVGSWTMFFGNATIHNKLSIHAEAQYRDFGIYKELEQALLRSGINFHYSSNLIFTGGYGRITNYLFDNEFIQSPIVIENRLWQQVIMRNNIGRCFFEHRYRLEQRWVKSNISNRYLNRIRYLLRLTVPLNKKEIEKKALFLSFYDEVFINFSPNPFDRNRLYGALGYQFLPNANIQLGYMAQTLNVTTKSYLQLSVFYNIDFRKDEKI